MLKLVFFSLLLAYATASLAEIYQWVDAQGQVHFGSSPPRLQVPYKQGEISRARPSTETQSLKTQQPSTTAVPSQAGTQGHSPGKKAAPAASVLPQQPDDIRRRLQQHIEHLRSEIKASRQAGGAAAEEPARKQQPAHTAPASQAHKPLAKQTAAQPQGKDGGAKVSVSDVKVVTPATPIPAVKKANAASGKAPKPPEHKPARQPQKTKPSDASRNKSPTKAKPAAQAGAAKKDAAMCGIFSGYVKDYEYRLDHECEGSACEVYQRQLQKYQAKKKRYCADAGRTVKQAAGKKS
jgi:hypothetical protein